MSTGPQVVLYDTTLRDGTQREGLTLSAEDKLRIVSRLDELGIDYVEGGFPGSNPKDIEFFERAPSLKLHHAVVTAFGSTCHKDVAAADDEGIQALIASSCSAVCIFGKAWDLHVTKALHTTLAENLRMVGDSVTTLRAAGLEVFFDAEHFFDGYLRNPGYATDVCRTAAEAGAKAIVLCDTNGGTLPQDVARITSEMIGALPGVQIGIHAHDDAGCAVANSLLAVERGATHVQGTMNGYGERAGNADLVTIIPALKLKMGLDVVTDDQLRLLAEVSHFVAETANLAPDPHHPYVGTSAFAHKGGVHASGAGRMREAYEHVDPGLVGNLARVVVSELAGAASIRMKAEELGLDLTSDPATSRRVLDSVKRLEHKGYSFEAADGSLEVLLRRELGTYEPFFVLESFRCLMEKREDGRVTTEATVKIHVGDERLIATAEGNGPVNALDGALRLALDPFYPDLAAIELTDYKVRVLDETKGTGAVTRVLIESTDDAHSWGTVGVSENIIEASWEALVDSLHYGLSHPRTSD